MSKKRYDDESFAEEALRKAKKEAADIAKKIAREGKDIAEGTIRGLFDAFNPFN